MLGHIVDVKSVDPTRLKVLLDCFVHQSREAAIAGNLSGLACDILGKRDRALYNRHVSLHSSGDHSVVIEMDALQRQLLIEGLDDWVGLWRVARKVREILGEVPTDLAREAAVRRLRPLLIGGYIEAGYSPYEKGQFEPWGLPPEAAISRIDSEWRDLADDPNIWEICRFRNTEKGDALAQSLVKNEVGYPDSVGQ